MQDTHFTHRFNETLQVAQYHKIFTGQILESMTFRLRFCWSVFHDSIIMTSKWARWRLKSPGPPLFTQPFIGAHIKKKHQSSASLTFVRGIHRGPLNSPHKWPVTRKMFPFDDVIMNQGRRLNLLPPLQVPCDFVDFEALSTNSS